MQHRGRALAIPAPDTDGSTRFFFPTSMTAVSEDEIGRGGVSAGAGGPSLKEGFRRNPGAPLIRSKVIMHLLGVIRHATAWFQRTERAVIEGKNLRWQVNIGVPTAGYGHEMVCRGFKVATVAAWLLRDEPKLTSDDLEAAVELASERDVLNQAPVEVAPEVAAEVVGYARSPYRQEGLFFIADVGAATFDVCGFRLYQHDGQDQYAVLSAMVAENGSMVLHRRRLAYLADCGIALAPSAVVPANTLSWPVPPSLADCSTTGMAPDGGKQIDDCFVRECAKALMDVIHAVRDSGDPNAAEWRNGVPIFLCGGGSFLPIYAESIRETHDRVTRAFLSKDLEIIPLPIPEEAQGQGITDDMYRRLAVAYGLSHDSFDIGEVEPPSKIPDIPRLPVRDYTEDYVGPELM